MYPFLSNSNNKNTNNEGMPVRLSIPPLLEVRNTQNSSMIINNATNISVPDNRLLLNQPTVNNMTPLQNYLALHRLAQTRSTIAPPPGLSLPNFQSSGSISNSLYLNYNNVIQSANLMKLAALAANNTSNMRSFDDFMSTNARSTEDEFKINSDEFPALPEYTRPNQPNINSLEDPTPVLQNYPPVLDSEPNAMPMPSIENLNIGEKPPTTQSTSDQPSQSDPKPRVRIMPDGTVINIPHNVIKDQFGIIGTLLGLDQAAKEPSLAELSLGMNLNYITDLDLNSSEPIHPLFSGPFNRLPLSPHQQDFDVPPEYRFGNKLLKLPDISLQVSKYKDDLLFYLFYTFHGEKIQLIAANELYGRGWRYHRTYRVWVIPAPEDRQFNEELKIEKGLFYIFDYRIWRTAKYDLNISYSDLEGYQPSGQFTPPHRV